MIIYGLENSGILPCRFVTVDILEELNAEYTASYPRKIESSSMPL